MVSTTAQLARDLHNLGDNFVIAVDEDGVEYIIDSIGKACRHYDNPYEYCLALKLKRASSGCIKREENIEMYINFATVNDVALFTTTCDKYDEDIDIYFGHMCFDAKSLGANMNLIGKDAKVVIHTDDESVENKFKEDVNLWIVKKG